MVEIASKKEKEYFYSEMIVNVVGLEEKELSVVRIFSNPVNDLLQVDLPEGTSSAESW